MSATYQVVLAQGNKMVISQAGLASSWVSRMVGLLRHDRLADAEGLIFPGCYSIHTFGMRFAIDAIFIDRQWRIVALKTDLVPGKVVLPVLGAWGVIEVAQGIIKRRGLRKGDQLQVIPRINYN